MSHRKITDRYLQRSITLLRAAEGEGNEAATALQNVFDKIAGDLRAEGATARRVRLPSLQDRINARLEEYYGTTLPDTLHATAMHVIEKEVTWNVNVLMEQIAKDIVAPKAEEIILRTASKTYQGHTFDFWTKHEFGKQSKQVNALLQQGYAQSIPIGDIERSIADISGKSRRDVRTLVRSSFMHNATEAKETVFAINPALIEGAIWVSVLDNRTTPFICGIRDGLLYDEERNPVGHTLPWDSGPGRIHWNCRSISIPKLVGVDHEGNRAATEPGADYERGDNVTRTGRVRKNTKAAREEGIYKTEQYTTRTRYENWLRAQSKHNIDFVSDVLGSKESARLFRDGETSLLELGLESPVARPLNRNSL